MNNRTNIPMNDIQIFEKYFIKFKELTRKKVGEEKYSKMTEQELLNSATALITLLNAVYRHINREDYEKYSKNCKS